MVGEKWERFSGMDVAKGEGGAGETEKDSRARIPGAWQAQGGGPQAVGEQCATLEVFG
jgi:hypothetical protein